MNFSIDDKGNKYISTSTGPAQLMVDEGGNVGYKKGRGFITLNENEQFQLQQRLAARMPGKELPAPEPPSNLDSMGAGFKNQLDRMWMGGKDLGLGIRNMVTNPTNAEGFSDRQYGPERAAIAQYMAQQKQAMQPHYRENPIASTIGGAAAMAPAMLTPMSASGAVATGATTGLMDYESTPQQDLAAGLAGQAVGNAIAPVINKGAQAVNRSFDPRNLQPFEQRAVQQGYKMNPGDISGGKFSKMVDTGLERIPTSAGVMEKAMANNQDVLHRQFAAETGIPISKEGNVSLNGEAIDKAFKDVSNQYDVIYQDAVIVPDTQFANQMQDISKRDLGVIFKSPDVKATVQDLWNMFEDGSITGQKYQQLRSNIVAEADAVGRATSKSQPGYEEALNDLVRSLDELAERNLQDTGIREANRKWRLLKSATEGAAPALDTTTGKLSAPKMRNKLVKKDNWGFYRGNDKSPLYDGVRFMTARPNDFGNSGTAQGMATQGILTGMATGAATGDIVGTGAYGVAAMGLPWATAVLRNSVLNPTINSRLRIPDLTQALMRGGRGMGLGANLPDYDNQLLQQLMELR